MNVNTQFEIEIYLPPIPKVLYPNVKRVWQEKYRWSSWYHAATRYCCLEALQKWHKAHGSDFPTLSKSTVQLRLIFHRKARRDDDSILSASKSLFDGLKDAGLIRDDRSEVLTHLKPEIVIDKERDEEVVVILKGET